MYTSPYLGDMASSSTTEPSKIFACKSDTAAGAGAYLMRIRLLKYANYICAQNTVPSIPEATATKRTLVYRTYVRGKIVEAKLEPVNTGSVEGAYDPLIVYVTAKTGTGGNLEYYGFISEEAENDAEKRHLGVIV